MSTISPSPSHQYLNLLDLMHHKKYLSLISSAEMHLGDYPEDFYTRLLYVEALKRSKQYHNAKMQALSLYDDLKTVNNKPNHHNYLMTQICYILADIHVHEQDMELALEKVEESLSITRNYLPAINLASVIVYRIGDYQRASEIAARVPVLI